MYALPTKVTIDNTEFTIRNNGDYRVILDVINALTDYELDEQERLLAALIIFYPELDSITNLDEATKQLFKFISCDDLYKESNTNNISVIDWKDDEGIIVPAINRVVGKEIRTIEYMHWWTFIGAYMEIGECVLSTVMSIRYKIKKGKKLSDIDKEFKKANPQYFIFKKSENQQEQEDYILSIWNQN